LLIPIGLTTILALPRPVAAADNLDTARALTPVIILDNERRYLKAHNIELPTEGNLPKPGEPEAPAELVQGHNLGILPQLGTTPEAGVVAGFELSDINIGKSHTNVDLAGTYSTRGVVELDGSLSVPHLFNTDLIGLVQADYKLTPTYLFFGLGNNNAGPNELSTQEVNTKEALFTAGYRLGPHTVLAGTLGVRRTSIGPGNTKPEAPATTDRFPDLPGLPGGWDNPYSLALIYNTHRDFTRPAQGWNIIGRIQRSGPELGSDYDYTRFTLDASYLFPLGDTDHVLGVRLVGEHIFGSNNDVPFFDFASLGGLNNLQGFYDDRFLGQSKIFGEIEYRQLLADFNAFDIWRARIDGTLFISTGRVFLDRSRLPRSLLNHENEYADVTPGLRSYPRFSYGAGVLIALSEAITARINVGFSNENKALVFLAFGQNF
jgi:outer membrane protein assembly factor BamA